MARLTRTEAYLALTLLPRIGPVRVRRLVESLGGPERVLDATLDRLVSVSGIGAEIAETLRDWENRTDLATEKRRIAEHGIDLGRSIAYAGHGPDLLLLAAVGRPCVVNPDFTLRKAAKEADWPVVDYSA